MTGNSSFNRPSRRRHAAAAAAVSLGLVASALAAGAGSPASAGERGRGRGDAPVACAVAVGSRQQAARDEKKQERRDEDKHPGDARRGGKDDDRRTGERSGRPGRGGSYGDFGWYGRGGPGDLRSPRPQEWEETQTFMRQFAPRRHAAVEQMPEGSAKESVKKFLFARYRGLRAVQRRDPAGFEQRLAQLRVEDQIFGVVSDWNGPEDEASRQQLREALRTPVAQLVDLDLQERQRRVEWLKRELEEETEELDRDLRQRDAMVDRRVSSFADWATRWAARRREDASDNAARQPAGAKGDGGATPDAPAAKPEKDGQ